MLTTAEKKLLVTLLDYAANRYVNHGCNDFDMIAEAGLTELECREVQRSYAEYNGEPMVEEDGDVSRHQDFALMSFLAAQVKRSL